MLKSLRPAQINALARRHTRAAIKVLAGIMNQADGPATARVSSKRLIEDKLKQLGLGEADGFKIFEKQIQTPGGGVIIFVGLQDRTAESIKSLEGFQRAWIEEAQVLSQRSLTLLRPTIRAKGSQIWASWNPRRKSDALGFHVVRDPGLSADFGIEQGMPFIRVSEVNNGHAATLLATLAHEMIHLRQHLTGDREHHGPRFRRMAARVCAAHGFDPKIF